MAKKKKKKWDDGSATRDKLLPPLDCKPQAALASASDWGSVYWPHLI